VITNMLKVFPRVIAEFERIAQGQIDPTARLTDREDEFGQLCDALGTMKQRLQQIISKVRESADVLTDSIGEMTRSADDVQQRGTKRGADQTHRRRQSQAAATVAGAAPNRRPFRNSSLEICSWRSRHHPLLRVMLFMGAEPLLSATGEW